VENGQVGVFAAYASRHGYCILDNRLFIPKKRFGDDYWERRKKCKFPGDISFRTKPQLSVAMREEIVCENVIPFRYLIADTIFGVIP